MPWKSERAMFGDRFGTSSPPQESGASPSDEAFPTVGEVMHEIAVTIAGFLAIALAANLLLTLLGV